MPKVTILYEMWFLKRPFVYSSAADPILGGSGARRGYAGDIRNFNSFCENKSVQTVSSVRRKEVHFRSVGVMCEILENTFEKPTKMAPVSMKSPSKSPTKQRSISLQRQSTFGSENTTSIASSEDTSYSPSNFASHSNSDNEELISAEFIAMTDLSVKVKNFHIKKSPKEYLGISEDLLWILDLLTKHKNAEIRSIKLVLTKLKLNDTFDRIGDDFGISRRQAGRIFSQNIEKISEMLKVFISFQPHVNLQLLLSIPFRANYQNVQSIIDCFEIEIMKPSDSLKQALTWSEYKHCNTMKYLISVAPDGTINFISEGFGGRTSDMVVFENSGIMEKLPENACVMADRGFKQIETLLQKKKCTLVRPPSVSSTVQPSSLDVNATKKIASLRIHVERVIRRLREFEFLGPHSCVHHALIPFLDSAVVIAAALINLQPPIIRT